MDRKSSLKKMLHEFKKQVNRDFPIYKMIFFGSRARGKSHKDSDIDLIIVSKNFKKLNFIKRAAKMYDYWDLDHPVDFLCYTPEEFKKRSKQITIVREALKEGVVI